MPTNTYYSPFFPAAEVVGAKGTTIAAVPSERVQNLDTSITQIKQDVQKLEDGGFLDSTPPAGVSNISVVSSISDAGADVTISYTAPSDNDLAGYDISVREGLGGNWIDFSSTSTSYSFRALKRNQLYNFRVRAYDKAGNRGPWSGTVDHTTARDTVPPAKPTNVAVETSFTTANIRWLNGNENDLSYANIYLYSADGTTLLDSSRKVSAAKGGGNYIWVNLAKATSYQVAVELFDTSNNGSGASTKTSFTMAGGIAAADFTPGLAPIATVTTLPTVTGYTGPNVVFFNGKLFRLTGGAWQSYVDANDLTDGSVNAAKLAIGIGGGNLIKNSSFDNGSYGVPRASFGNGFGPYNNTASDAAIYEVQLNGRRGGYSQLVEWTGPQSSTKGIIVGNYGGTDNSALMKPNSTYTLTFYAKGAGAATGAGLELRWNTGPVGLVIFKNPNITGEWQRYQYKIVTGSSADPNIFITTSYVGSTSGYIYFDDIQLEEGDVATAYAAGLLPGEISTQYLSAGAVTADKVAANSINANKLVIQTRPVSTSNINIRVDSDNVVRWNAGSITYPDDSGNYITRTINAGGVGWNPGWDKPVNLCYDTSVDNGTLANIYYSADLPPRGWMLPVATWNGGKVLSVKSGIATLINGDGIVARSIKAENLVADSITANEIKTGTITAAQIAAGAITATKLAIGNTDNVIPDGEFRDATFWGGDARITLVDLGFTSFLRGLSITPSGGIDVYSAFFPVEPGATYRITCGIDLSSDFNGFFHPCLHIPGQRWQSLRRNNVATTPGSNNGPDSFSQAGYSDNQTVTVENAFSSATRNWQIRFNGSWTGRVLFSIRIVRVSDTTIIKDGAITTDKITVGTLNGDRITTGTLDAATIRAGSILSGNIQVSGTSNSAFTLGSAVQVAIDPATRINNLGTTQISPGLINISGVTTLANWRAGGDNTKIEGGNIYANSIKANSIQIGARGISTQDLIFRYGAADLACYWSAGAVLWVDDNGNRQATGISAGGVGKPPQGSYYYIYWVKGSTALGATTSYTDAIGSDRVHMATYNGTPNINQIYGGTIIHGSEINTGSITADRLSVSSLSAITANIGSLVSYNGQGGRVERDGNGTRVYHNNGQLAVKIGF